jgi:AcrR family transcriptional regulator
MTVDYIARKQPKQERSIAMQRRILDASIRVLREDGALGFTTTRVAEEAGISVGSLYQYFPNKHALVMALHRDDVRQGWAHIQTILFDQTLSPRQKLDEVTVWFFESERDEVREMGAIGGDITVFLRDAIVEADLYDEITVHLQPFVTQGSTIRRTPGELKFATQFLVSSVESIGKSVAAQQLSLRDTRMWAKATSAMLADFLQLHPTLPHALNRTLNPTLHRS